jgi:hypothetical protein
MPPSAASAAFSKRLDRRRIAEIGRQHVRALAQLRLQLLQRLHPRAAEADVGAPRMQRLGDRAADAAGSAGDQRALAA